MTSIPLEIAAQHSVHPTGGSLRVFKHFAWLEVGSDKIAWSRPAHQRVTHTVGRAWLKIKGKCSNGGTGASYIRANVAIHFNHSTNRRTAFDARSKMGIF